jgi:hypothetical protein
VEVPATSYRGFESINVSASGRCATTLSTWREFTRVDASSLSDATLQVNLNDRHIYGSISQIRVNLQLSHQMQRP